MNRAPCWRLTLLLCALPLLALPKGMSAGQADLRGNALAGGNGQGTAVQDSDSATAVCYASPHGNDSADGLTLRTAKQDVMSCYDAIPGGTIVLMDSGPGVPLRVCTHRDPPGCGIWIMGPGDPNFAHLPAGWRKEKTITFAGGMATGGGAVPPDYQTRIVAGGTDAKHPAIWLSSAHQVTFENISITSCLPAMVGIDSNRGPAVGHARDNVFDNVGLFSPPSVGCGPGMLIGSSSTRNFIRHSQFRGSAPEHAVVASITRQSGIVTFTAVARLPASWNTGKVVSVLGAGDPSFDGGNFTITVTGARKFTYPQAGPDAISSGGRAASDGSQAIVMNPRGAAGNSLSADDVAIYDGAIEVYAGASATTLNAVNVHREEGFGPAIWIATCGTKTNVNAHSLRTADDGKPGAVAAIWSDCTNRPQAPAAKIHRQNASAAAPPTPVGGAGPSRATANPPSNNQHGNSIARTIETKKAFAVQVGAFRDPANADRLRRRIGTSYGPVVILRPSQGKGSLYRVCVGHESSVDAARELTEKLRSAKLATDTLVVRVD